MLATCDAVAPVNVAVRLASSVAACQPAALASNVSVDPALPWSMNPKTAA